MTSPRDGRIAAWDARGMVVEVFVLRLLLVLEPRLLPRLVLARARNIAAARVPLSLFMCRACAGLRASSIALLRWTGRIQWQGGSSRFREERGDSRPRFAGTAGVEGTAGVLARLETATVIG